MASASDGAGPGPDGPVRVRAVAPDEPAVAVLADVLAAVLVDCVDGGASVGFLHPLTAERARAFWVGVLESAARRERVVLVAEDADGVIGTAQMVPAPQENQPHRAEVAKMLVHRRGRRRGVGEALLRASEDAARAAGRTLMVLDTAGADAARLYERNGWVRSGVIPGYALWPDGSPCDTTVYWKRLDAPR